MSWSDVLRRGVSLVNAALALLVLALIVTPEGRADAPVRRRNPDVGYAYPAGGQRGTMFRVTVGGQRLRSVKGVYISGGGVRAKLVRYEGAYRRLNGDQRRELQRRLAAARRVLAGDTPVTDAAEGSGGRKPGGKGTGKSKSKSKRKGKNKEKEPVRVDLPNHPLLAILDSLSAKELDTIERRFLVRDVRRQPNAQIAETVLIEVTIEPSAETGVRDLRLVTRTGLTNPLRFEVGTLREARLPDLPPRGRAPPLETFEPPVLVNGQVLPGEVDRFRVRASRGQQLVVAARARALVPYLADAVPGWFQATVTVRDATGREVAFADDFRFDPDPVLLWKVAADGEYEVEIADSIYRGREDFVYRLAIGELPYATDLYPLGAPSGTEAQAIVSGWNLAARTIALDTSVAGIAFASAPFAPRSLSQLPYEVESLPTSLEAEPNETAADAQPLRMPRVVDGRIGWPGDVDLYQFSAEAGERVVAELHARRLRSPLDSLLEVTDSSGRVLAWNDDYVEHAPGLLTHEADSRVSFVAPEDGVYRLRVSDLCGHGGDAYAYRLRVGPPRPDFSVAVTPSSVTIPSAGSMPLTIHVRRSDGFDGELQIRLAKPTRGYEIVGGRVPAGCDRIRVTLRAPPGRKDWPRTLSLVASGRTASGFLTHAVTPADDVMQAFLYRHLVPANELLVHVLGGRATGVRLELPQGDHIRTHVGDVVTVGVRAQRPASNVEALELQLVDPLPGVTLTELVETDDGWTFGVRVHPSSERTASADNLIVEVIATMAERDGTEPRARRRPDQRRVSLGYLPAIPLRIVGE